MLEQDNLKNVVKPLLDLIAPRSKELSLPSLLQIVDAARETLHTTYDRIEKSIENTFQGILDQCMKHLNDEKIQIVVESRRIRGARKGEVIPARAKFRPSWALRPVEIDCYVACGHFDELGDLKNSTINLMDNLDKLLPKATKYARKEGPVGLVTFQNGIMNSFETDFKDMSESIVEKFPEGPLCIGLYNPTTGSLLDDLERLSNEKVKNQNSVYSFSICS